MTDERDKTQDIAAAGAPVDELSRGPAPVLTRRMVLRGATAVVPTVLTLHSGAALARSSNLLGAALNPGPEGGVYRCVDTDGLEPTGNPKIYDLGSPPYAHVTRIDANSTYYYIDPSGQDSKVVGSVGGKPILVDPPTMCANGGTYYRADGGGFGSNSTRVEVKRGFLCSATALSSFSSGIRYTDV